MEKTIDKEQNKRLFMNAYKEYVKRPGSIELLNWIENSDFFEAPASSKFHLDVAGGLCEHSLNVCRNLKKLYELEKQAHPELTIGMDKIVICGLLHDLCKANFYKTEMRNVNTDDIMAPQRSDGIHRCRDRCHPAGHYERSYQDG